jgi:hypothetical protein
VIIFIKTIFTTLHMNPDILSNDNGYLGRTKRCQMRLRTGYPRATHLVRVATVLNHDNNSVLV